MITSNVIQRTFFITFGNSSGTAFSIDVAGKRYLVTARHVIEGIEQSRTINLYYNNGWHPVIVEIVGLGDKNKAETDIAVLAPLEPTIFGANFPLPANTDSAVFGQNVYFLGYPYGMHTITSANNGYPVPMIKGALLSGANEDANPHPTFFLDGHNNPGFSGGPVVFYPYEDKSRGMQLLGVVSAYRSETSAVTLNGQPTELTTATNTGIVICPSIAQATRFIEANPIGPDVPA